MLFNDIIKILIAVELSLGSNCYKLQTMVHELLHGVGLYHEHTRADRDKYIEIKTANIAEGRKGNFNKRTNTDLRKWFDFESIMLYGDRYFSNDRNSPTIVSKVNGQRILEPTDKAGILSKGDIEMLSILYHCK